MRKLCNRVDKSLVDALIIIIKASVVLVAIKASVVLVATMRFTAWCKRNGAEENLRGYFIYSSFRKPRVATEKYSQKDWLTLRSRQSAGASQ